MPEAVIISSGERTPNDGIRSSGYNWRIGVQRGSLACLIGLRHSYAESLLAKIARPEQGDRNDAPILEINIAGKSAQSYSRVDYVKLVSYFSGDPESFFANLQVDEEIGFHLENLARPQPYIRAKIDSVAQEFGISDLLSRPLDSLSGGQRQLVAIAATLCTDAEIFLFDDPLANLDLVNREAVLRLLRCRCDFGATILFSHLDWSEWVSGCDSLFLFDGPKLAYQGFPISRADTEALLQLSINRDIASSVTHEYIDTQRRDSPRLELVVDDLTFCYQSCDDTILKDAYLTVDLNDIVGIVGSNGSGKTTFAKIVAGLLPPSSGRVSFLEMKSTHSNAYVTYQFQDPKLQFLTDSALDEVAFPHRSKHNPQVREAAYKKLSAFNLEKCHDEHPLRLSHFDQRKLILAALMFDPPHVLIVDEPTNGLDLVEKFVLTDLLKKIHEGGTSIMIITHDAATLNGLARTLILVKNGTLSASAVATSSPDLP